ncbi:LacI family transcriptional regulator [Arthrobacter pigmenti]|uniref:LacI family transcriptional regulator n=1 Tax=Arthrobacter pigmenti TaxID=271432 RepID=A0A846RUS7_9MICC|nr:LacI family DNA-binding transcriptional regulator [Arthrobacter pigmenti]NJC24324.1 LacI family transcriptional regulator [Arthrobacter pigmenti]
MTELAPAPTANSRVTRQDVARYAGVSSAVVSYVVNGGPKRVAPATAAKVIDAIEVLGYRPNAAARALKLGSAEMLGLVIPSNTNTFYADMARAVEEAAADQGFALLTSNSSAGTGAESRSLRNFRARQVDGVLLATGSAQPDLSQLKGSNIPVVLLDAFTPWPDVTTIGVDFQTGAARGVRHLIGHGHTDIGLVIGYLAGAIPDKRELGWLDALTEAGLSEGPIVRTTFDREGGYSAGRRMFEGKRRPTAAFVSSDMQAVGMLRAIHELGLSVPDDVAIVSFDGSAESEFSWPPLTTLKQPVQDMAEKAVSVLGSARRGEPAPEGHHVYGTELIVRRSCGCSF